MGVQKASGGAKMAIRGAKLTFGGGKMSTKAPGAQKATRKVATFFLFCFLETKIFVLCRGAI